MLEIAQDVAVPVQSSQLGALFAALPDLQDCHLGLRRDYEAPFYDEEDSDEVIVLCKGHMLCCSKAKRGSVWRTMHSGFK